MNSEIIIQSLSSIEKLEEVRRLESKIWGDFDSIPVHQTSTAVKNGGLVLGAFNNGNLIGFQYSFPGFDGKSVYLCSHVLATDPNFRNHGVGEKLKLAQRDEAKKKGYSLITWTYDPLESINGYLNIQKLGGVCSTYIPNCYGDMDDLLNSGIPSDRFLVKWDIGQLDNNKNGQDLDYELIKKNSVLQWETLDNDVPIPSSSVLDAKQVLESIFVAIPKNFRIIKEKNFDVAQEWRMKTRVIFTKLFNEGWQVTGFKKIEQPEIPVNFYMLTKRSSLS